MDLAAVLILLVVGISGIPSLLLYSARREASDIEVPAWTGWVAFFSFFLLGPFVWIPFSIGMYFKGKSDGATAPTDEEPRGGVLWSSLGWLIVAFTILFIWYAVIHLPTMIYREGVRVSAAKARALPAPAAGSSWR